MAQYHDFIAKNKDSNVFMQGLNSWYLFQILTWSPNSHMVDEWFMS